MEKLTAKQLIFVSEYCIHRNATQAAIKAGYAKNSARVTGHENLRKPQIVVAIKSRVDQQRLLCDYTKIKAHKELEDLQKRFNEEDNKFMELKVVQEKIKLHSLSTTNINMQVKTLIDYIDELDEN